MTDAPTASLLDGHRRLEVPPGVEDVDLERKFAQLLFRASLLGSKLTEQQQAARSEQRELLGILVEVDDALAALGLDGELVALGRGAGIEATRRRLLGRLAKAKVRPMRLEGMTADPDLTEIVGTEARAGVAPETVVRTVVTGFFWGDEVLRRAQVVVAAPGLEPEPALGSEPDLRPELGPELGPESGPEAAEAPESASAEVGDAIGDAIRDALQGEEPGQPADITPATPEPAREAASGPAPEPAPGPAGQDAASVARAQPKAAPPRARRKPPAAGKRAKRKK
ncbi:nucleotide exchange factor GrpE [Streptomyces sp. NRRL S-350]|uniref:nucleotide exchange factor GrpE n=1 Tax=Streptomyces sp. NRRL S-350 TaxID=1463902 RepID=UPI0004BF39C8|nr:nucleotide exchange factor GrpE [Streptomyces sp. NRRL S-350]